MDRELVLPPDFEDYAWEVESKGVFWDATVRVGDGSVAVTFYDPARLSQEVNDELNDRSSVELVRTLIVPSVTEKQMRDAVARAPLEFFG